MQNIIYQIENNNLKLNEILNLYNDAGWTNYTDKPEKLISAFQNSTLVISAKINNNLIGFIRVISDKETIVFIQDIIVLNEHHRKGIGKTLVKMVLEKYKDIRQIILLTDNDENLKSFYNSVGFKQIEDYNCKSSIKINE